MTRLVLALVAVGLIGTGCGGEADRAGSVNIYWAFVKNAPAAPGGVIVYDDSHEGTADGACDESGVEIVTVDSPAGQVVVDCVFAGVEGVGIDGIGAGTRPFRVRGWRGDFVVYDLAVNLRVSGNATTDHLIDVPGVPAPLDMFADLAFGVPGTLFASCAEARPAGSSQAPDIGFEIRDFFGDLVDEGLVVCNDPLPALIFSGDLDLDNYTVRTRGFRREDGAVVFDSCALALDHFSTQVGVDGFLATLFTQPLPTCP